MNTLRIRLSGTELLPIVSLRMHLRLNLKLTPFSTDWMTSIGHLTKLKEEL